jgi:hypothetical protein
MKLLVSEYEVEMSSESTSSEFHVKFCGPKESAYEGVSICNLNTSVGDLEGASYST